jgi:Holliday junction DNA helicase RuvA
MIAYLEGPLKKKAATSIVVLTGGVGYEIFIPLSTFYELPEEGERVCLHVSTVVRDDAIQLFGFLSPAEKEIFLLLTSVSKIGPKLALNLLSGIRPQELVPAVLSRDVVRLSAVPGVGVKTAERIILELKDKMQSLSLAIGAAAADRPPLKDVDQDVVSALLNLGYRRAEAEQAVLAARARAPERPTLSELLRLSLKMLTRT